MRVLFTVSDWSAHYYPMVPLGWAIQAAGHELRVACGPGQAERIGHAGLPPLPVLRGRDPIFLHRFGQLEAVHRGTWPHAELPPHPETGRPMRGLAELGDLGSYLDATKGAMVAELTANLDELVDLVTDWGPDLVVHDLTSLHGVVAAAATNTPGAVHLWGPVGTAEPPELDFVPTDRAGLLRRYGVVDPVADLIDYVIDPCPAALAPPTNATRLAVRYLPYTGAGALPDWLATPPERPRVCLFWGSSLRVTAGPDSFLVPDLIRAFDGLDIELVVLLGADDTAALGEPPAGVRLPGHTPLPLVLPTCAAVVHHGGDSCLMPALHAGLPQLSVPVATEQQATGRRLAATGAGLCADGRRFDPAAVRDQLVALLRDPSYRDRAVELRRQLDERPTPAQLVPVLETLAAAGCPDRRRPAAATV
ncbi:nucleotide disphospho-sugar-binding domain-containing protein [Virgisporangium aurantiacum]|uniref:Glycosyl transferase n=1 Tax=Virgisporangium aurantiacum TaxID=175570 RepID=A0A8J3ZEZ3_9ACTN|nr:nucleotide disphospho-sugar-binding domain-containing protein [Virgisporangium aurantiacum]GIJ60410.1 glycosyl transferase [Virgisporangium aurantiacum]